MNGDGSHGVDLAGDGKVGSPETAAGRILKDKVGGETWKRGG